MLQYLKNESNKTFTENGAVTLKTTQSDCVDLFATIGALRRENEDEIVTRFMRAFTENQDIATKLLFYARDVRGGLGERKVFRAILKWLANNKPSTVRKNLSYIAEYGRYDDLFVLLDTPLESAMLKLIKDTLNDDLQAMEENKEVSLLAKWLPSVNASNKNTVMMGKKIAKSLDMSEKEYRTTLAKLRAYIRILENNLREKDYTFDYSQQPSKAMFKYRKAFIRNDFERYNDFISKVSSGEVKLNASTLYPYELVNPFLTGRINSFMRDITEEEKIHLTQPGSRFLITAVTKMLSLLLIHQVQCTGQLIRNLRRLRCHSVCILLSTTRVRSKTTL